MRYAESYPRNPCSNEPGDFVVGDNLRHSVHVLRHEVIVEHAQSFHGALEGCRSLYVLLVLLACQEELNRSSFVCSLPEGNVRSQWNALFSWTFYFQNTFFFTYSQVQDLSNVLALHFMLRSLYRMATEEIIYWGWNFISEYLCRHFAIIFTASLTYIIYTLMCAYYRWNTILYIYIYPHPWSPNMHHLDEWSYGRYNSSRWDGVKLVLNWI